MNMNRFNTCLKTIYILWIKKKNQVIPKKSVIIKNMNTQTY